MNIDGNVQITGRINDLVLRGGENIYPREIEEFLLQHPDILDVQVIGVPDSKYGEELMAWIRMKPNREGLGAAREHLAPYLRIRRLEFYQLPKTISGKIRRVELRRREEESAGIRLAGEFRDEDFTPPQRH